MWDTAMLANLLIISSSVPGQARVLTLLCKSLIMQARVGQHWATNCWSPCPSWRASGSWSNQWLMISRIMTQPNNDVNNNWTNSMLFCVSNCS
jgi:hypothetical protein